MPDLSDNEAAEVYPMSRASSQNQELARRLIVFEAARANSSDAPVDVAMLVIGELRLRLVKLAGAEGFRSLLSRALTLSKMEAPALQMVQIGADGSVEGLDGIDGSEEARAAAGQAGAILVAHLLQLLVTFIGTPLTLRLVRDTWPDASMDGADSRTEENP
jgi:hypothetical protein